MKIFPITRKVIQVLSGAGVAFGVGADSQAQNAFSAVQTLATGNDEQAVSAQIVSAVLPQGTDTQSLVHTSASTANVPQGTDEQAQNSFALTQRITQGVDAQSGFLANYLTTLSKFVTGTTSNVYAGTTDWNNQANAQGAFDGAEASFVVASGLALTTAGATLTCTGLVAPAVPPGSVRTGAKIALRHRWDIDITLPQVDSAGIYLELLDNGGTNSRLLMSRLSGSATDQKYQPTLITEIFDIQSLVSDAQLAAGLIAQCSTSASLSTPASGDMSWYVDGISLQTEYSGSVS